MIGCNGLQRRGGSATPSWFEARKGSHLTMRATGSLGSE